MEHFRLWFKPTKYFMDWWKDDAKSTLTDGQHGIAVLAIALLGVVESERQTGPNHWETLPVFPFTRTGQVGWWLRDPKLTGAPLGVHATLVPETSTDKFRQLHAMLVANVPRLYPRLKGDCMIIDLAAAGTIENFLYLAGGRRSAVAFGTIVFGDGMTPHRTYAVLTYFDHILIYDTTGTSGWEAPWYEMRGARYDRKDELQAALAGAPTDFCIEGTGGWVSAQQALNVVHGWVKTEMAGRKGGIA